MRRSTKRVDYTQKEGKTRGSQELIKFLGYNEKNRPIYTVKCNNCRHEYISTYYNFIDVRRVGISCKKCSNSVNKEYKLLSLSESQLGVIYSNYKSKAKVKNWKFELTKEEFSKLIYSNCHYCGTTPNGFRADRVKNKRFIDTAFYTNGVDRIDSNEGYIHGNVLTCCEDCNKAKRNLSYSQFIQLIKDIYKNLKLS